MGRMIIAVVAGAVVWAALWLGGNQAAMAAFPAAMQPETAITSVGVLLGLILYGGVLLSLLAGWTTGKISRAMKPVWVLAGVQLMFGIIAEVSYWSLTPVWYHVVFLALIVPMTVLGGRRAVGGAPPPPVSP